MGSGQICAEVSSWSVFPLSSVRGRRASQGWPAYLSSSTSVLVEALFYSHCHPAIIGMVSLITLRSIGSHFLSFHHSVLTLFWSGLCSLFSTEMAAYLFVDLFIVYFCALLG